MRAGAVLGGLALLAGSPASGQETPAAPDTIRLSPLEARVARMARSVEHLWIGDADLPFSDLADWLSSRTAVQIRSYGGGGRQLFSIRGSRPEGVLVLLDGLPLNDPVTGTADLSGVTLPSLGSATLVRGAGSARYGSGALGGALLLTSRGGEVQSSARLATGSEGRFDAHISSGIAGRAGQLLLTAARRYSRNDFDFRNRLMPGEPEERRRNADSETKSIVVSGSSGGGRATVRYDRLERGVPGRMGTSLFSGDRWSEDRWSVAAVTGGSGATVRAGVRDLRLRYVPGDGGVGSVQRAFDGRLGGETLLAESVAVSARLSFERISGGGITGTPERLGFGASARRTFEAEVPGFGTVGIEPVIGLDRAGGETSWSPELGVWVRPSPDTRVYGRVGRGFRHPTFGDLYFGAAPGVRANPDLRSERITLDAEMGVEGRFRLGSQSASLRLAAFARHTDRPIVWLASAVSLWSPRNLDQLRSRGIELEAGLETDPRSVSGVRVDAGLTIQRSRVGFGSNRNLLPYQPESAGSLALEGRRGPLTLTLRARFTGSRTTSLAGTRRLPAFTVIDTVIRRRIDLGTVAVGIGVRVDNVWDRRYELVELFPEPGRQLTISLDIT